MTWWSSEIEWSEDQSVCVVFLVHYHSAGEDEELGGVVYVICRCLVP